MAKRLFLIDGTAVAYRAHFAFTMGSRGGLTTSDGRPTSAVFGFVMTLKSLLDRENPDAIAISFDGPTKELERTKSYPDYKATREDMPDELFEQLAVMEEVVAGYHIPVLRSKGHEADDVIGTLAIQGRAAGMQVFMVTGDKDFMQLVDADVKMWNLRSSTSAPEIIGPKEVALKYGVRPDQMIDFLALMGDSSDNVPGVPRVGPKTAAELLQQFDTLDAVLENTENVKKPSIRKSLVENRELAIISKDLVTIRTDVPLSMSIDDLGPAEVDREILEPLFRDLEFDSLIASLPRDAEPEIPQSYDIVRTVERLDQLLDELRDAGSFALDTETTSLDTMRARLVGISVSYEVGTAYYIPFNLDPPILEFDALLERLRPLLEDSSVTKTLQNVKYDKGVFRTAGVELAGVDFDTMLASYVLSPGEMGGHGLDAQCLRHFSYKKISTKEIIGTGKKQKTFDQVDVEIVGPYAAEDADFTWRLRERHAPLLEEHGLEDLFHNLEMPLIDVLLDMEREGIAVDLPHLEKLGSDLKDRLTTIEDRIFERAGEPFNLNSPAQIGTLLFDKLEVHRLANLRPKKTKTGQWKTDASMLEKLAPHHEVPELLLDYRRLSKLKSTYVDSLPRDVNPDTGRIHSSFNQAVAATGRLSSDEPNLQNIPIRTEEGRKVRRAFVSRGDGWVLLSADYSQIELRILAHMSEDPGLVGSFNRGEDIHVRTISLIHGIMPEMVTPELRSQAKVVNYGLMYGMGASRLANETGMTPPEAKKFIQAYFRALPEVKAFLDRTLEMARETLEVRTLFGRRRLLPEIESTNVMQRIAAENMAINTPIQGTAADIIKRAMLDLHHRLNENQLRAKLLLQVHDELVLDVPEEELDQVIVLLRQCMEGAVQLRVPLEVTMGHGRNWLEAH